MRRIAAGVGLELPEEALARLRRAEGDAVYVSTDGPEGALQVSRDAEYARQLGAGEAIVERYANTFADLAK